MSAAVAVWAVLLLLGLAAQPIVAVALRGLPGAAAGMARPLGLLLAAFPLWLLASLKIVPYGTASAWASVALLVAVGAYFAIRHRGSGEQRYRRLLPGAAELVFTAAFLIGLFVVSHRPDVWGTERPLDMALVNTVDASRHFPPLDPWLSGHDLNYYYFGQYLMAFVIRLAGVAPDEGYNVCVALVFALSASAAFGLGGMAAGLIRGVRGTLLGATALSGLAVFAGNAFGTHLLFKHDGPIEAMNWFSVTRVVPGAVNDFPAFELVIGDLHAHVIAVPFMLVAFAFAVEAAVHGPRLHPRVALSALVLGSLLATNIWSAPAAFAVVVLAGALNRPPFERLAAWAGATVAGAVLLFLPFHLTTSTGGTKGVGVVPDREPLGAFVGDQLAMYGFALIPALAILAWRLPPRARLVAAAAVVAALPLALADDLGNPALAAVLAAAALYAATRPGREALERMGMLLLAAGLGCVATAELVYLRDAFDGGEYFRFNTAFKVGFDAWLLIAAAAAMLLAVVARRAPLWIPPLALLGVAAIAFPPAAAYVHTGGFKADAHLDGLRWLAATAPGDPPAIEWVRENTPRGSVVLEANGPEYSPQGHARISVFSGRPTVLGWAGHELFYHPVSAQGTRAQDIQQIYETPDPAAAAALMQRYDVRYVVVGPLERQTYPALQAAKFGRPVFSREGTEIYATGRPAE
jgi:YYY domain-containing protein